MIRFLLLALLIYAISAKSCSSDDTKEKLDVQVIELDDSSSDSSKDSSKDSSDSSDESSDTEIVTLHLTDRRRREIKINNQTRSNSCRNDDDCGPGLVCLAHLTCIKGTRRPVDSLELNDVD